MYLNPISKASLRAGRAAGPSNLSYFAPSESFDAMSGNPRAAGNVTPDMSRRAWVISILLVGASLAGAAYNDYASAKQKLDAIETGRLRPGARVVLTFPELNAVVLHAPPPPASRLAPP
jgi:hypothetical protein